MFKRPFSTYMYPRLIMIQIWQLLKFFRTYFDSLWSISYGTIAILFFLKRGRNVFRTRTESVKTVPNDCLQLLSSQRFRGSVLITGAKMSSINIFGKAFGSGFSYE